MKTNALDLNDKINHHMIKSHKMKIFPTSFLSALTSTESVQKLGSKDFFEDTFYLAMFVLSESFVHIA